jgi:hypothetical protein
MTERCGSSLTARDHAAVLDEAAFEDACMAEDLALLASVLEEYGCPCVAEAFRLSARQRRVQSLLHKAQAVAWRVM